jgi:hypothetical protein
VLTIIVLIVNSSFSGGLTIPKPLDVVLANLCVSSE